MSIDNKPLASLEESDLTDLIASSRSEGKVLEFKANIFGGTDDEKKEFLADLSSFANTDGGHIIFGMKANQGIASDLPGIPRLDSDTEKLRIENITRDSVAPRITGISIASVKLKNGNHALVIHIPRSWGGPHMVTYKGTSRFFARNSAGKYPLDVHEIRQAFLLSEGAAEKIRNFRLDRISRIIALDTPVALTKGAKVVLHWIPLSAFQSFVSIDLANAAQNIYTLLRNSNGSRFNLDGIVTYGTTRDNWIAFYAQLFRNGIVEFVDNSIMVERDDGYKYIPSTYFEEKMIESCENILNFQSRLGIEPPALVYLAFVDVMDYTMGVSENLQFWAIGRGMQQKIDRDTILLPEVTVQHKELKGQLPIVLKPIFDACWNASGWPRCMDYDENGNWKPSRA